MSVTLHTQTPPPAVTGQAVTGRGPGPCVPHRCPTMVPLARSLRAWLVLPSPSRWLLRTIRFGCVIQFDWRPPKFRGIRLTSVKAVDAPILCVEIAVLLAKDAIEPVPPADMGSGFSALTSLCSVGAELLQDFIRQDGCSTETLSETPGAYGCSCGNSSTRSAPYETASALAPWPNPEVDVDTRYSPGSDYTSLPQNLQLVIRSLVPSGRNTPGSRYPDML